MIFYVFPDTRSKFIGSLRFLPGVLGRVVTTCHAMPARIGCY